MLHFLETEGVQTCNHQNLKSEEGRDRRQDRKWGQKQGHGGPYCHRGFNSANHQEPLKGLPGELKFQIDPLVGSMKSGRSRKRETLAMIQMREGTFAVEMQSMHQV